MLRDAFTADGCLVDKTIEFCGLIRPTQVSVTSTMLHESKSHDVRFYGLEIHANSAFYQLHFSLQINTSQQRSFITGTPYGVAANRQA